MDGSSLDLSALSFPELTRQRREAIAGLRRVSSSLTSATSALGLGPTQRFEIERNRALRKAPVMPAIERYTGVLYDGLDAASLNDTARGFLDRTTVVHSALFGLLRAADPIPAYRFSHNSRVPGMPLGKLWRDAISGVLARHEGLVLDLRSEMYADLGPAPAGAVFLRVVTRDGGDNKRALNHFNKQGKGLLLRRLALSGDELNSIEDLLAWASTNGVLLEPGAEGELDLVV